MKEYVWYCPVQNELFVFDEYDTWLTRQNNWMGFFYVGEMR